MAQQGFTGSHDPFMEGKNVIKRNAPICAGGNSAGKTDQQQF
jgi:hypothetical protein